MSEMAPAPLPGLRVHILWDGGWDDYQVEPAEMREMTEKELADDTERIARGWGCDPVVSDCHECGMEWLKVKMVKDDARAALGGTDTQLVRIIRHLGGGERSRDYHRHRRGENGGG